MKLENPYCTLLDVQAETGNSRPDAVEVLSNAINLASRYIDAETGRDFLYHDFTTDAHEVPPERVSGCYITIPWPCVTPSGVSVSVDGEAVDASEFRVVNDSQSLCCYLIRHTPWIEDAEAEVRIGVQPQKATIAPVQVRGVFGYEPTASAPTENPSPKLPGTLRYAATQIAAVRSGKLMKEFVGADGSRQSMMSKSVPKDAEAIIRKLKLRASF